MEKKRRRRLVMLGRRERSERGLGGG